MTFDPSKMRDLVVFKELIQSAVGAHDLQDNFTEIDTVFCEAQQKGESMYDLGEVNNDRSPTHQFKIYKNDKVNVNQWAFWRGLQLKVISVKRKFGIALEYDEVKCTSYKREVEIPNPEGEFLYDVLGNRDFIVAESNILQYTLNTRRFTVDSIEFDVVNKITSTNTKLTVWDWSPVDGSGLSPILELDGVFSEQDTVVFNSFTPFVLDKNKYYVFRVENADADFIYGANQNIGIGARIVDIPTGVFDNTPTDVLDKCLSIKIGGIYG